jgi:hypothetical protein
VVVVDDIFQLGGQLHVPWNYVLDGATKLKTYWFNKAILASTLLFVIGISGPLRGIIM